jgi:hypothetical protein
VIFRKENKKQGKRKEFLFSDFPKKKNYKFIFLFIPRGFTHNCAAPGKPGPGPSCEGNEAIRRRGLIVLRDLKRNQMTLPHRETQRATSCHSAFPDKAKKRMS